MISINNSRIPAVPPATLVVELILLADIENKRVKYIRHGKAVNQAQVILFKRGV
jgi:hypothetical protein